MANRSIRMGRVNWAVAVWIILCSGSNHAVSTGMPGDKSQTNRVATQTLSGSWKLAVDPDNRGRDQQWFASIRPEAVEAPVPGVIQQVFPGYHGVAWYWHAFRFQCRPVEDDRLLLRFGAVDYLAEVWLNGVFAGAYEGGETTFEFDVTDSIRRG